MKNFPINLLATAQTVIGKQDYLFRKYIGRVRNAAGYQVSSFAEPTTRSASVQPIRATQYQSMGLDLKKAYIKIYDTDLIEAMTRDSNADQVIYDGYVWRVADDTPWFLSGGWNYVMCVRLEKYVEVVE